MTWFAERMTLFKDDKIHKIFSSMYIYEKFDKETVKSIVDSFDITHTNIFLYSKSHEEGT